MALPPGPLQVSVKVLSLLRESIASLPEVGFSPDQSPVAVQDAAFSLSQDNVVEPFASMVAGWAVTLTAGKALSVCPPPPQADRATVLNNTTAGCFHFDPAIGSESFTFTRFQHIVIY